MDEHGGRVVLVVTPRLDEVVDAAILNPLLRPLFTQEFPPDAFGYVVRSYTPPRYDRLTIADLPLPSSIGPWGPQWDSETPSEPFARFPFRNWENLLSNPRCRSTLLTHLLCIGISPNNPEPKYRAIFVQTDIDAAALGNLFSGADAPPALRLVPYHRTEHA